MIHSGLVQLRGAEEGVCRKNAIVAPYCNNSPKKAEHLSPHCLYPYVPPAKMYTQLFPQHTVLPTLHRPPPPESIYFLDPEGTSVIVRPNILPLDYERQKCRARVDQRTGWEGLLEFLGPVGIFEGEGVEASAAADLELDLRRTLAGLL